MSDAVENHRRRDFVAHVADDFIGRNGELDAQSLGNLLRVHFLRNQELSVSIVSTDVELLPPNRAVSISKVILTGGSGDNWIPDRGEVITFTVGWRKDDQWQVINAEWDRI